jgi:hypothetical protein
MPLRLSIFSSKIFSFSIMVAALAMHPVRPYDANDTAREMPDRAPHQA